MDADLLNRRERDFVLWRLAVPDPPPTLVIGQLQAGAPVTLAGEQRIDLTQDAQFPDLWSVSAQQSGLADGVYHYWFEVTDARPDRGRQRILITDPLATTVDWRLRAPLPAGPNNTGDDRYPASVICCRGGTLISCDCGGETWDAVDPAELGELPPNNRIVIYELPTAWSALTDDGSYQRGVGTFRDVQALVDDDQFGANFAGLGVTAAGRAYLAEELGINALELLPPADSAYVRTWDYGTTNFLAPDFELGLPIDSSYPTPNRDLGSLVNALHRHRMRFFVDSVTAFSKLSPYLAASPDDFFIDPAHADPADPDQYSSRPGRLRDGYGSTLFRYETFHDGYDPLSGDKQQRVSSGSALMRTALVRWMTDFHVDGIRMDSVENVFSWDFVGAYCALARTLWLARHGARAGDPEAEARFLVVGEELEEPLALLTQRRLDGLWHEDFMRCVRAAIVGRARSGLSFEETVRRMIDCRVSGYADLAQAVIYLTSHDVEGEGKERLYDYLQWNRVVDCEKRVKLAFACLLTAVGIPQILAGEEFADRHDLLDEHGHVTEGSGKQIDPVNYSRLDEDWRRRVKEYVGRLVHLRTSCHALAVNDVDVIHVDLNGKQVVAWRRGVPSSDSIVVVVANFSDFTTPAGPGAEYVVRRWPPTPPGCQWREAGQDRLVPPEWIGREPIFSWEAKVYVTCPV
jgi:pullulanase